MASGSLATVQPANEKQLQARDLYFKYKFTLNPF